MGRTVCLVFQLAVVAAAVAVGAAARGENGGGDCVGRWIRIGPVAAIFGGGDDDGGDDVASLYFFAETRLLLRPLLICVDASLEEKKLRRNVAFAVLRPAAADSADTPVP